MSRKKYSFLVLTDHEAHRPGNPVYYLLPELLAHPQTACIDIASRGNNLNDSFFHQLKNKELYVHRMGKDFAYREDGKQFLENTRSVRIADYDAVLMRLPRPITDGFMDFVVKAAPKAVFVNHPLGIEKTSNKTYLLNFPDIAPPMKLCFSIEEILQFKEKFPIVLKPLEEYGGKGLVKVDEDLVMDGNEERELDSFLSEQQSFIEKKGYLAMKFLKNVKQGDKRIIVVGGEILGASLRLPAEGSWLCNVAQGGTSVSTKVETEEVKIIQSIAPALLEEGILIFGADTLVDDHGQRVLSEINTLSVGGFQNMDTQSDKPILKITAEKIIEYCDQKS